MRRPEYRVTFVAPDGRSVIAKIRATGPGDVMPVEYEGDRSILKAAPEKESVVDFVDFIVPANEAAGLAVTWGPLCIYDNPDEVLP